MEGASGYLPPADRAHHTPPTTARLFCGGLDMLTRLRLKNFKNFEDAELALGPLTVLVGTNASGKSNLRDAFRFLHGISRGYSLAQIFGGKVGEGGERQWAGIRGGIREVATTGCETFLLEVDVRPEWETAEGSFAYSIEIEPRYKASRPRVVRESLFADERMVFDTLGVGGMAPDIGGMQISAKIASDSAPSGVVVDGLRSDRPVLTQVTEWMVKEAPTGDMHALAVHVAVQALASMRFFEFSPEVMREPCTPGEEVMGDHGDYLSSVLLEITEDAKRKEILISWLQELTPMDVADLEFPADQRGNVLVTFVEQNGRRVSAHSASDGTLRFLATLAALLGRKTANFHFFEEPDSGLHPARLDLLTQLLEKQASEGRTQIVASTHSPQFLRLLREESREHASLVFRLEDSASAQIRRIVDVPDARRVFKNHDLGGLLDSGWFEDMMEFDATPMETE